MNRGPSKKTVVMYEVSFFGTRRIREHSAKTPKGAVNWLRRNKWFVVESAQIKLPDGTIKRLSFGNEEPDIYFDQLIKELECLNP